MEWNHRFIFMVYLHKISIILFKAKASQGHQDTVMYIQIYTPWNLKINFQIWSSLKKT